MATTRGTSVKSAGEVASPARRRLNLPIYPAPSRPVAILSVGRGRRVKAPAPRSRGKSGRGICTTVLVFINTVASLLLLGFRVHLALPLARVGADAEAASLSPIECCRCCAPSLSRSERVTPASPAPRRNQWRTEPRLSMLGKGNSRSWKNVLLQRSQIPNLLYILLSSRAWPA